MAISKTERLNRIHGEALREFNEIQQVMRDQRLQCLEDRRFYSIPGAQWEGAYGELFANKPRIEINKVAMAVIRIINEYRQNRITVNFIPKDGASNEDTADVCDGLYRADEQDSSAREAYDNAFEEAVGGGFGAWRLRACYEDEYDDDDDRQRIKIEPIFDADSSVFFDLSSKKRDHSDATRCFVLTGMTWDAYREEYDTEATPSSFPKLITNNYFDWATPDVVYIAEYYRVEEKTELKNVYRGLTGDEITKTQDDLDEDPHLEASLKAKGYTLVRQKKVKCKAIHKYILSGARVESDEGIIAGKCIPVIPVYGKRWFVDNVERCMGHVRLAKDAQRLANMLRSNLAEIASLSPTEKPIFTPQQIGAHAVMWSQDNIKNFPYLLVDPITDANGQQQAAAPLAYTKAPSVPPALAALIQISEQDLKDILGDSAQGEQMRANISGEVVDRIQGRLDQQAYIYMDNLAVAQKRCGEVWLSMMGDIAVEEGRKMKTVNDQGEIGSVTINEQGYDEETDETTVENDISKADFDVVAEVGPASSSKREATVRKLTTMMQMTQDPSVQGVLTSMALMNMEGEGISDIRQWARGRLVQGGVIKPTDQEQEEMDAAAQNQQPDPNAVYLLASAQKQEADARKTDAEIVDTLANAALHGAQAEKTQAEADATRANTVQTGQEVAQAMPGGPVVQAGQAAMQAAEPNPLTEVLGNLAQAIASMNQPRAPRSLQFHQDEAGNIVGASEVQPQPQEQ